MTEKISLWVYSRDEKDMTKKTNISRQRGDG